jgi:hypothetical protein
LGPAVQRVQEQSFGLEFRGTVTPNEKMGSKWSKKNGKRNRRRKLTEQSGPTEPAQTQSSSPGFAPSTSPASQSTPAPPTANMSSLTPTIDRFLSVIASLIRDRNGFQLQQLLPIEPPFANDYNQMINEIQTFFPPGQEKKLENKCTGFLPEATEGVDGAPWSAFIHFMVAYLGFIRSVDPSNLLETYNSLSNLVQ